MAEVNALTASEAVLNHFWDLAAVDETTRNTAAAALVQQLKTGQSEFEEQQRNGTASAEAGTVALPEDETPAMPATEAEGDEIPPAKRLELALSRCAPIMTYSLRRLARGLSSGRQGARQGFATALTMLISSCGPCLDAAGVMTLIEVVLDGANKGGDAKDRLLGKLFGISALLRSGMRLDTATASTCIATLLDIASRRSYLRESATAAVVQAVGTVERTVLAKLVSNGPESCESLAAVLASAPKDATAEMLLLCLVLWPRLAPSGASACKLLPPNTPCPPTKLLIKPSAVTHADLAPTAAGLFDRAYLTRILQPLLSTTSSHPRLHSLWEHLLGFLIPGYHLKTSGQHHSDDAAPLLPLPAAGGGAGGGAAAAAAAPAGIHLGHLEAVWGLVVEDGLMESSHERKYLGLALFQRLLPHVRAAHVPVLLSPAFCRTLLNSAKNPTTYLHASAKRCLERMTSFVERPEAETGVKMAVAAALQRLQLAGFGASPLAAGGGNKLAARLLSGLDGAGVHTFIVNTLQTFVAGEAAPAIGKDLLAVAAAAAEAVETEGQQALVASLAAAQAEAKAAADVVAVEASRANSVEQLLASLRFSSVPDEDRAAVIRFLATHAFFAIKDGAVLKTKVPELLQAAAMQSGPHPLTAPTRRLCAQRLVTLLGALSHPTVAKPAQIKPPKKLKDSATPAQVAAAAAAAEVASLVAAATAAAHAASAAAAAAVAQNPVVHLQDAVAFLHVIAKSKATEFAGQVPGSDDVMPVFGLLRDLETALAAQLTASTDARPASAAPRLPRVRALLPLVQLLQLHLLGDPIGFEGGLAIELTAIARDGFGVEGLAVVEAEDGEEGAGEWSVGRV
ncbi:MAG: hypothetical protein WDW38_004984 [Sanguina aurantia]